MTPDFRAIDVLLIEDDPETYSSLGKPSNTTRLRTPCVLPTMDKKVSITFTNAVLIRARHGRI
jgi:hypothetical protein